MQGKASWGTGAIFALMVSVTLSPAYLSLHFLGWGAQHCMDPLNLHPIGDLDHGLWQKLCHEHQP